MRTVLAPPLVIFLLICTEMRMKAANPYATIDLNVPTGDFSRYHGTAGRGDFGVPVFGGFDCDGDGHLDYGFSQMKAFVAGRNGAGQVTWILGDGMIGEKPDPSAATYTQRVITVIGEVFETAGSEAWMDDVNGDGFGDLLVASQNYSKDGAVHSGEGALTVVFGGPDVRTWAETLTHFDLRNPPTGANVLTILGAAPNDRLGIWMRTADVNGDGVSDIAVGADMIDSANKPKSGGVYVIQGGAYLASHSEVDLADFGEVALPLDFRSKVALVLPPTVEENYHFGATVTVADLDGNGRAEVIAAATLDRAGAALTPGGGISRDNSQGGTMDGSMFIAWDENFPPGPWPSGYTFHVTEPLLGDFTRIDGETANVRFGEELIGGEDFSGDGFSDFFVGDLVGESPNGSKSGIGHVFYNAVKLRGRSFDMDNPPTDIAVSRVYGPEESIGADTMALGDFDNDGIADLACGNPHDKPFGRGDAGSVHVFYGQPGGWPAVINLAPNQMPPLTEMRIVEIAGREGEVLCYGAASGDINDDGVVDLIVNEMVGSSFNGDSDRYGNLIIMDGVSIGSAPAIDLVSDSGLMVDFGMVTVGSMSATMNVIVRSTSGNASGLTPVLVGPEANSYQLGAPQVNGDTLTVPVTFTPGAVGPHGAAVSVLKTGDLIPLRVGLKGIGETQTCIENDFFQFGESTLMRFNTDFGATYLPMVNDTLGATPWQDLGSSVTGTGSWSYLLDASSPAGSVRGFYKVVRQ